MLMRKWDKEQGLFPLLFVCGYLLNAPITFAAAQLVAAEQVMTACGVPSIAMDFLESALAEGNPSQPKHHLEGLVFGGALASETLVKDIQTKLRGIWW